MKSSNKIRVLIFERQVGMMIKLLAFFEARPDIEVVEANRDVQAFVDEPSGMELRALMDALRPDAVIVDLREPLREDMIRVAKVRELSFVPLIAFTDCKLPADRLPAVRFFEVVRRPAAADERSTAAALRQLAFAIRRAKAGGEALSAAAKPPVAAAPTQGFFTELIAIGASAGGTEAILEIASVLPPQMPPILVVQHITRGFGEVFALHIDRKSKLSAAVAVDGETPRPGCLYVAPDSRHLTVAKQAGNYILRCTEEEKVSGHRPSVDALFRSVAAAVGERAIGVLLTGMGKDGAAGLRRMYEAGALTIGQDEDSSLVYGMPRAAYELGAVRQQLPLDKIAGELVRYTHKGEASNG